MTDNITVTLKPCPFCGGEAMLCEDDFSGFVNVECDGCHVVTDGGRTKEQATAQWNTRTQPEAKAVEGDVVEAWRYTDLEKRFEQQQARADKQAEWAIQETSRANRLGIENAELRAAFTKSQDSEAVGLLREARAFVAVKGAFTDKYCKEFLARIDTHLSTNEGEGA